MAAAAIFFDPSKPIPIQIRRALTMMLEGRQVLINARAAMLQMRDGDGSLASHYDLLAAQGGYQAGDYADANAAAKASFDELDSLHAKVNSDASVSAVMTALNQAAAKHGVV